MIGLWAGGGSEKVLLVGWSEGAGLCVLGAAGSGKQDVFAGVVAIGLGEQTVLGWRLADALTWITRRVPNEPTFRSVSYLAKVAPLRLAVLHSSGDEYTRPERVKEMFAAAAEPKRLDLIEARNHRFDGGRDRFFSALRTSLDWTAGVRP
jgi:dienelactone hydrolase